MKAARWTGSATGLVLTGVNDPGAPTYKRTGHGDAEIDRAVDLVLRRRSGEAELASVSEHADIPANQPAILLFSPYGYDERQYGSPGFALPVGCLMRPPHGTYPQHHTSADDLDFVSPQSLADSLELCLDVVEMLEGNGRYRNLQPKGEPQLARRGLYRDTGGDRLPDFKAALLWVLSFSDGDHDLLEIARRSGLGFTAVRQAADALREADLLAPA